MVGAANHMGDAHVEVVNDDGEVIERCSVAASDDSVADLTRILPARPEDEVVPAKRDLGIDSKAYDMGSAIRCESKGTAVAAVETLAARGDVRIPACLEIFFAADAAVGMPRFEQLLDDFGVAIRSFSLAEWPFIPIDPEPFEPFEDGRFGFPG